MSGGGAATALTRGGPLPAGDGLDPAIMGRLKALVEGGWQNVQRAVLAGGIKVGASHRASRRAPNTLQWRRRRQCKAKCRFAGDFDRAPDQLCRSLDRLSDHLAPHWWARQPSRLSPRALCRAHRAPALDCASDHSTLKAVQP